MNSGPSRPAVAGLIGLYSFGVGYDVLHNTTDHTPPVVLTVSSTATASMTPSIFGGALSPITGDPITAVVQPAVKLTQR